MIPFDYINQLLSVDQNNKYFKVFNQLNPQFKKKITIKDYLKAVKQINPSLSQSDLNDLMNQVNVNNTQFLEFDQFMSLISSKMNDTNILDEYKQAFEMFDRDRNGLMTAADIKNVIINSGQKISDQQCQMIIKEINKNGQSDGNIDFEKFISLTRLK